jgi:hypothetical protein
VRAAARHIWELVEQGPLPGLILAIPPSLLRAARWCSRPLRASRAVRTDPRVRIHHLHLEGAPRPLILAFSGTDNLEHYFELCLPEKAFPYRETALPAQIPDAPDVWFTTRDGRSAAEGGYRRLLSYCWVRQVLEIFPLRDDLPGRLSKGLVGRDLKALQDSGYEARLERSSEALKTFYNDIYLPHVRKRFAEEGRMSSLTEMALELAGGTVLLCCREGGLRSGGIITIGRDLVGVPWLGAAGGDARIVKEGGLTAVYHEALKLAVDRRVPLMDFSNTRPFVSDGIFRHKKRWGCVVRKPFHGVVPLAVEINMASECAHHFFRSFPLIHFQDGQARCVYGMAGRSEIEERKVEKLRGLLSSSDVSGMDVLGEEDDYRSLDL